MNRKVEIFKALSDEIRVRILNLFIRTGKDICVCELMYALRLPQYTISKALNILRNSDLFSTEKKGLWVYYKMNFNSSDNRDLFEFLKSYIETEIFREDEMRLNERLLLRENDKCIIGTIPEEDLYGMIKSKIKV